MSTLMAMAQVAPIWAMSWDALAMAGADLEMI
jgi:hypothetical protein